MNAPIFLAPGTVQPKPDVALPFDLDVEVVTIAPPPSPPPSKHKAVQLGMDGALSGVLGPCDHFHIEPIASCESGGTQTCMSWSHHELVDCNRPL